MSIESKAQEIAVDIVSNIIDVRSFERSMAAVRETRSRIAESQNSTISDYSEAEQQAFAVVNEYDDIPLQVQRPQPLPSLDPPPDVESFRVTQTCADLFRAALSGDCETVLRIEDKDPAWLCTGITKGGETVLHIAAAAKHLKVVETVISSKRTSLVYTNKDGSTPFCFAAVLGVVEIAQMMRQHNYDLPNFRGKHGMTPLHMAVLLGHRAMVWYLLKVTNDKLLTDHDRVEILTSSIDTNMFDIALHMLENNPELALLRDARGETALHALARKPLQLQECQPNIWKILSGRHTSEGGECKEVHKLTETLWNQVMQQKKEDISASIRQPWRLLFVAARLGNVEFLTVLIRSYPDLIWKVDENGYSIFHVAVISRQVHIFKLIYEIGAIKNLIATYKDCNENNMLHLASKLAPPDRLSCVSGAALQMQRELQWFEAVKQIVRSEYTEAENKDKKTPQALFSEEHETLRKQGEEWIKKTAESCALVAALIATMVFTAAFQLPGGVDSNTGSPVLVKQTLFVFFAMTNAVSLFTSTSAILVFLSIITSRYAERDFLVSLPKKLMTGLVLLLISIATLVVGFTVIFFIIFQHGLKWPPIIVAVLGSIPVTLFALQQFPLLAEMYYSTYKSRGIFQPGKKRLYEVCPSEISARTFWGVPLSEIERPVDRNLQSYLPSQYPLRDSDIYSMKRSQITEISFNLS